MKEIKDNNKETKNEIPFEDDKVNMKKCKFFNILDQGMPLDFTYGGRVVKERKTGKIKTNHERYSFQDQEVVTVPDYIVKHINSLVVPNKEYNKDKMTGQITHSGLKFRNRCSLTEV